MLSIIGIGGGAKGIISSSEFSWLLKEYWFGDRLTFISTLATNKLDKKMPKITARNIERIFSVILIFYYLTMPMDSL